MARGMELDGDIVELDLVAAADRLRGAGEILAIAQPHHVERFLRRQHGAVARTRMVGMAVRDDGARDGADRIDMEAAGFAAQAGGVGFQDVLRSHAALYRRSYVDFYPSRACLTRASVLELMPARLFLSSGDLRADRRFEFARDLQLKGDPSAAADLLQQAIALAPDFTSAWFMLAGIREQLGEQDAAIAALSDRAGQRSRRPPRRGASIDAAWRQAGETACRRPMCKRCSTSMRRDSKPHWSAISAIAVRPCCSRPCCRCARQHASRRCSSAPSTSAAAPGSPQPLSPERSIGLIGVDLSPRMIERARATSPVCGTGRRRHAAGFARCGRTPAPISSWRPMRWSYVADLPPVVAEVAPRAGVGWPAGFYRGNP